MSILSDAKKEYNDKVKANDEQLTKQTRELLKSGTAFTNPLGEHIESAKGAMSSIDAVTLETKINRVATKLNIDPVELSDIQDIMDKANAGITAADKFKSHTDELSGVSLSGNKNIANITKVVSALETDIGQACSPKFSLSFGSLLNEDVLKNLKEHAKKVSDWFDWFDDDSFTDSLLSQGQQDKINALREKIDYIKGVFDEQKAKLEESQEGDESAYDEAINELVQVSVAKYLPGLLENKCMATILSKVQSPGLTKAIDEYNKKKEA